MCQHFRETIHQLQPLISQGNAVSNHSAKLFFQQSWCHEDRCMPVRKSQAVITQDGMALFARYSAHLVPLYHKRA